VGVALTDEAHTLSDRLPGVFLQDFSLRGGQKVGTSTIFSELTYSLRSELEKFEPVPLFAHLEAKVLFL